MQMSFLPRGAGRRHRSARPATVAACLLLSALCACSQKTAQEKGAEMAGEKIDMVAGIGDALKEKGGMAAETLTTGVGTVFQGAERGALKAGRKVNADGSLAAAGLQITKVQDSTGGEADAIHGLQAYVVARSAAAGTLRMFAYDALNQEIGRSSVQLTLGDDDAKYVGLALDKQVDLGKVEAVSFKFVPKTASAAK